MSEYLEKHFAWLEKLSRERKAEVISAEAAVRLAEDALVKARSDLAFAEYQSRMAEARCVDSYAAGWRENPEYMKSRHG